MIVVYVLYSDEFERYYTGMTDNIDRRLYEHNIGKMKSTKAYKPWRIIYSENHPNRAEARKREKFLKSGSGREFIRTRSLTG